MQKAADKRFVIKSLHQTCRAFCVRNIDDQRVLAVSVKVACGNVQIGVGFKV